MRKLSEFESYNQRNPQMYGRSERGLRLSWLSVLFLVTLLSPSVSRASTVADSARQLAQKIGAATGPGAITLDVANRSSLDEKSLREARGALEAELRTEGIRIAKPDQAMGSVLVTFSESLREYVWTAEIGIGTDEKRIVIVTLPRTQSGGPAASAMPVTLRKTFLFSQPRPILDAALIDISGSGHLLVLDDAQVGLYRQQAGRWELEATLAIAHARPFPRDPRGRLILRRDHLFDAFLPGTICRSSATVPLSIACADSDDPWPLTPDDGGVRAFFAPSRNFFTGVLSPGIGKITNVPSFYSAAPLPRSGYTLWVLATVDGSVHLVDGMTDQAVRSVKWGGDLSALHSACGTGTQMLASESGDGEHDSLRAFEIPDRDPVAASAPIEFEGRIVALWPETNGAAVMVIVNREDTGWYEAYRTSISCGS